jgi:hypothetical protein
LIKIFSVSHALSRRLSLFVATADALRNITITSPNINTTRLTVSFDAKNCGFTFEPVLQSLDSGRPHLDGISMLFRNLGDNEIVFAYLSRPVRHR